MKSVTCLAYLNILSISSRNLVYLHETVVSYIANAEDRNRATEIGNELLQLSWAADKYQVSQTTKPQIPINAEIEKLLKFLLLNTTYNVIRVLEPKVFRYFVALLTTVIKIPITTVTFQTNLLS